MKPLRVTFTSFFKTSLKSGWGVGGYLYLYVRVSLEFCWDLDEEDSTGDRCAVKGWCMRNLYNITNTKSMLEHLAVIWKNQISY